MGEESIIHVEENQTRNCICCAVAVVQMWGILQIHIQNTIAPPKPLIAGEIREKSP